MPKINFLAEDVDIRFIKNKAKIKNWIKQVIQDHGCNLVEINYIFCSDKYLLEINQQYLNHDYYTDIITFDNSEEEDDIESDIFISVDRVRENAEKLKEPIDKEILRVIIHGVLHLIGYKDKTTEEEILMRAKENECLSLMSY